MISIILEAIAMQRSQVKEANIVN